MIHTANIGVGIYGSEGSEAASNADYAISEFKHLKKLLFNHGANIQYKITYFSIIFMFKSVVFSIIPVFFAFHSGYSGAVSIYKINSFIVTMD